ncbi:7833_t:CDS:2, partial [Funneliformis mosseae]
MKLYRKVDFNDNMIRFYEITKIHSDVVETLKSIILPKNTHETITSIDPKTYENDIPSKTQLDLSHVTTTELSKFMNEFHERNLESSVSNTDIIFESEAKANEAADPINVIMNRENETVEIAVAYENVQYNKKNLWCIRFKKFASSSNIKETFEKIIKDFDSCSIHLKLARSNTNKQLISILSSDIIEMKKFLDNIEG